MKKVNFHQIENFEIPEEWMEKALNAEPEKKPVLLRPRVLATAASIVLIAAVALLLFKPFHFTPAVAVKPAASEITETRVPATENNRETKELTVPAAPTESPIEQPTEPAVVIETEAGDAPDPTELPDDPSKYRIKDSWFVDAREIILDAYPEMNDTSLMLDESELYTGDLTVIVSADSPFADCKIIELEASAVYEPTGQTIRGRAYLEPKQGENGERAITINLFESGAYTPSGLSYTFRFSGDNDKDEKIEITPITQVLSSNNPVSITI